MGLVSNYVAHSFDIEFNKNFAEEIHQLKEEFADLNQLFLHLLEFKASVLIAGHGEKVKTLANEGFNIENESDFYREIGFITEINDGLFHAENHQLLKEKGINTLFIASFEYDGTTFLLAAFDDEKKDISSSRYESITYCRKQLKRLLKQADQRTIQKELIADIQDQLDMHRTISSEVAIGTWIYTIDTDTIKWSEEVFEILGIINKTEFTFDCFLDNCISDNRADIKDTILNTCDNGGTFDVVFQMEVNKENKWIRCKAKTTRHHNKLVLVGSIQDITTIQDRNFKFEGIFNSTYTFIGFLNADGVLLEANETALKIAGIQRKDVIGKKFWDCYWWQISQETRDQLKNKFNEVLATGNEITYDVRVWIRDRKELTILFSLKPVKDSWGNILYIVPEGRPIQDLVDSRKRYKNVIQGGQIGVWEWNMNSGVAIYNEEWRNILDIDLMSLQEPTIDDWYELIHRDDLPLVKKLIKEFILEKKQRFTEEFRMISEDGSDVWVEATINVHSLDSKGNAKLVYGNVRDISKRKIAEDELLISEKAFKSNFENASIGMALVSRKGGWIKVNDRITEILGYSKEELKRLTFQDITHPDDLANDLELLEEVISGKREHYQLEKRYYHKNGSIVYAILGVSVVRDKDGGGVRHFISQIVDITELKQIQRQLEQKNDHLEQFAHIAAHDLQQPLRTVTNYLSLYQKKFANKLDSKQHFYVDNAIGGALKMKELIKGILDFSKTRVLEKQEVDLSSLVGEITSSLEESIDKNVNINVGRLPTLQADIVTLKQLFTNLIENGLKYQEENNIPRVDVVSKDLGTSWLISVIDNGIGIREDQFERVFNLFQRLHSNDRFTGNGIGLATCKKIVNAYDGFIWLEHNQPNGLKVHIKLPKNS